MIPMNYDESSYTPLLQYDDLDHCAKTEYTVRRIRRLQSFAAAIGFVLLLTFSVIVLSPYEQIFDLQSMQSTGAESDKSLLSSCSARSEWRQLSPNQQEDYITAVRCLLSRPAQVQGSASRYLDWATTYRQAGYRTWYGAEFLPWHRYFIHLFETALREECAYTGSLPYWDWTIGLDNLPQNPVAFTLASLLNDHTDTAASIIRRERPMRDVSFPEIELQTKAAGLSALLPPGGSTYDQDKPVDIDDYGLNKDSVKQLMRQTDFEAFSAELQKYLHDTIRYGIGGDFDTPIAPKDPLYFLHLVQLDRLWTAWQGQDTANLADTSDRRGRFPAPEDSSGNAIEFRDLAPDVDMDGLMDTRRGFLCYFYD